MERVRRAFGDSDDLVKVGYGGAVGLVLSALGPWYSTPAGDVFGTDGGGPGLYVLILGVMAALVVFSWWQVPGREKLVGVVICVGGSLALMLSQLLQNAGFLDIAWGMWLGIAASVILLAVTARLYQLNPA